MKPLRRRRRRQEQPQKVVVEIATPEVIGRLEADNAQLRQELKQLKSEKDSLHHTVYRLMDVVGDMRRKSGQ